ncbi:hypothetical protein AX17_004716 [Amanita inopinata Kibby_2008]|nr:hypothetical protein AX17_004716 [Amanita inopinata Kibby_2008]
MVASSVSSPPDNAQQLSWAERAKKAQNIKSPYSVQPQRIVIQSVSSSGATQPSPNANSSPSSHPSSTEASNHTSPPDSSSASTTAQSSSQPSHPHTPPNGIAHTVPHDSDPKQTSTLAPTTPAQAPVQKSPVVNVWNLRMEQMAAARSASHRTAPSSSTSQPAPISSRPSQDASTNGTQSRHSIEPPQSAHPESAAAGSSATPAAALAQDADDDPFVVRIFPNRDRNPLAAPTLDDSEAWPEVGKSSGPKSGEKSNHERGETLQTTSTTPRKSEKKWVPLPAEEWQQTTEHKNSRLHPSKGHHSSGQIQPAIQAKNVPATNGSTSNTAQSRNQSGYNSVAQSATQSRINSRSGSVQSSPRMPRNKRLPYDETGTGLPPDTALTVSRPSGRSSSALHPQPDLQPSTENHQGLPGHVPMAYPTPIYGADNGLAPYYSRQAPHPSNFAPHHYRHTSAHSPSNANYRSGQDNTPPLYPAPSPIHYPSAAGPYPVYPAYPPFDYRVASSQQPYPYWPNSTSLPGTGEPYPNPGGAMAHYPAPSSHVQTARNPQASVQPYNTPSGDLSQNEKPYLQQSSRVFEPSEQSHAVAGYVAPAVAVSERSRNERPVTFGSIDAPDSTKSPAPESPRPPDEIKEMVALTLGDVEKETTVYTIGVSASEARLRSRTRPSKSQSRASTTGSPAAESSTEKAGMPKGLKLVDITDKEATLKFGFADGEASSPLVSEATKELKSLHVERGTDLPETQASSMAVTPLSSISASLPPLAHSLPPATLPHTSPGQSMANAPLASEADTDESDAFKVKDFGYGFGTGTTAVPDTVREPRPPRDRRERGERDFGGGGERDQEREGEGERARSEYRPRRGGNYGGYSSYERGGYGGRRGGRGVNGYSRGYNRGYHHRGGMHPSHSHRPPPPPPLQYPLNAPPSQFPPHIMPVGEHPNGFFPAPHQQIPPLVPMSYDSYPPPQLPPVPMQLPPPTAAPPLPAPLSPLSFPLDPTRYWLLGQLEYYLSPQNLAQDFYLRQQMDSKGWILITTLASFNRVKGLTLDYHTVREVLVLSSVVQVKDNWVRMNGWEQFVLPNAVPSKVEPSDASVLQGGSKHFGEHNLAAAGSAHLIGVGEGDEMEHDDADGEVDDEDEEEDVVFVMGQEAGWSPQVEHHHT